MQDYMNSLLGIENSLNGRTNNMETKVAERDMLSIEEIRMEQAPEETPLQFANVSNLSSIAKVLTDKEIEERSMHSRNFNNYYAKMIVMTLPKIQNYKVKRRN